jgi:hypothetical protein
LKLSSAIVRADRSRSRDLGADRLLQLKLSISARVLGGLDILLATTDKPGESAANSSEEIPAAEHLELHINPILLSSVPRLIHLAGRSPGVHDGEAAVRSYTLTLTFSDGNATAKFWSTTFDVPRSPLVGSTWHLTVPFSRS